MSVRPRHSASLGELFAGFDCTPSCPERRIEGLALDSRCLRPGDLFLALRGGHGHGLQHLDAAVAAGAAAVAFEDAPPAGPQARSPTDVPVFEVPGLGRYAGELAARFYGHPSRALTLIGVTGTNGKSSCCHLLAQALDRPQGRAACIGTLGWGPVDALRAQRHTTPDAPRVQAMLAALVTDGVADVAMEVSSHALMQGRLDGCEVDIAVFTNLSRDHLDYHGDMPSYAAAKQRLFERGELRHAVLNADDPWSAKLAAGLPQSAARLTYGFDAAADVHAETLVPEASGLRLGLTTPWGRGEVRSALMGRANAYNLLAVAACLGCLGYAWPEIQARLAALTTVPGRLERVAAESGAPLVVIDYAHSPAALEAAIDAVRAHTGGRLWLVFGCGGERDRGKRGPMGEIAERLADCVVVTDDNPRGESPRRIVGEILAGMTAPQAAEVVHDREAAIHRAIGAAAAEDAVLIAGKGHEEVQERDGERYPFSDRDVARSAIGGGS